MTRAILIGIDCSTDPNNVGLAIAEYAEGVAVLHDVTVASKSRSPSAIVYEWLQNFTGPRLLALDAPLGWPAPFAPALAAHRAGARLSNAAHEIFQRSTDRFVHDRIGKRPFDVGADKIARTAHFALRLVGDLGDKLGAPIPLFWQPPLTDVAAIEVYPAATLIAHGMRSDGYKGADQGAARRDIFAALSNIVRGMVDHCRMLEANADALDAAVCVLAAADVLAGTAMMPVDRALAEREGWIWVASKRREA